LIDIDTRLKQATIVQCIRICVNTLPLRVIHVKKTYDRGPYISHTHTRPNYVIPEQSVTVTVLIKIQFVFKFS